MTDEIYPEGGYNVTVKGTTLMLTLAAAGLALGYVVADHIRTPFDHLFDELGKKYRVDPNLLRAIAKKESSLRPDAISKPNTDGKRDYGLMQINANMFAALKTTEAQVMTPRGGIEAACRLIVSLRAELGDKLSMHTLVASYNAGSPAILRRGIFNMAYVADVMNHYQLFTLGRTFA